MPDLRFVWGKSRTRSRNRTGKPREEVYCYINDEPRPYRRLQKSQITPADVMQFMAECLQSVEEHHHG